ncbi:MAG TPA: DNA helicase UvrD [Cyanobacteria bacterium UBA11149]|nr:DNA helicase UvrD [Cyanobacteria bacterium UBA11367]HBE58127.1 DNA helicase UvrD [Cyanobacteria bacterium UBA11366]HBR75711.1 DNA helicase UvrD [Cyanobacteria bacterium UBA11159]HBS70535.1 DNA helicase UvrD [Cyanobacteria bacterium UBA11153]HBW87639.1 DNA helicase UvrD [Cyanobacteria bacterium UBA11149]
MPDDLDPNLSNQANSLEVSLANLREEGIQRLRNTLRLGQQSMADWRGGKLAVSAVPGAGKSTGMAVAAAIAIARYRLHSKRQLAVVTFTRSAAASIRGKIRKFLQEDLSLPQTGFVVYTLHGLALNIAGRHRDLSGLDLDNSTLVMPNSGHRIIKACVEQWIANHPRRYSILLEGHSFDGEETERLRRQSVLRTEVLPTLAYTVIHEAKSSGLLPEDLWRISQEVNEHYDILAVAAGLYEQYQVVMKARNFIDYDDMILAALRVLENDTIRTQWQKQFFAVFEDEAQDSTPLQFHLLETLAADAENPDLPLNLIRVGDPNQAINSTFTPADPIYFNWFCEECGGGSGAEAPTTSGLATMDRAGRSTVSIINAANFVLDWVNRTYPQGGAFRQQFIRPVDSNDPQKDANPQPTGKGLEIYNPKDIYQTVELIGERVIELLTENPEHSAAVLVRENRQGTFIAQKLEFLRRQYGIKVYDVGSSDRHSHVPGEILALLQFLDRPHSPDYLKTALEVLVKRQLIPTQDLNALATYPEQFLYPGPLDPPQTPYIRQAAQYCRSLLKAKIELPHYHLISFLGLTLKYDQSELATVDKLGERVAKQTQGNMAMNSTISVLQEIVNSERFEPVETEDADSRYLRGNQLTIITMHKAKGLDWDYVFLPFLHEDTIPGNPWVPTAAQFLGDFTLAEVARAQIRASLHKQPLPMPMDAWEQAAQLKTAEEYRLLYVAMTRAKRLLWMSGAERGPFRWNTFSGKESDNLQVKKPCPVLPALKSRFPEAVVALSAVLR